MLGHRRRGRLPTFSVAHVGAPVRMGEPTLEVTLTKHAHGAHPAHGITADALPMVPTQRMESLLARCPWRPPTAHPASQVRTAGCRATRSPVRHVASGREEVLKELHLLLAHAQQVLAAGAREGRQLHAGLQRAAWGAAQAGPGFL